MGNQEFEEIAINLICNEYGDGVSFEDIYIVWLCKILGNNKALLSTNVTDGKYYEVTYNGNKKEFYIDTYVKESNKCLPYVEL